MKTEQEIRDTVRALYADVLRLEQDAMASLRRRQAMTTQADALLREWAQVKVEMSANRDRCRLPYDAMDAAQQAEWGALCDKLHNVEYRMVVWASANPVVSVEAAE